MEDIPVGINDNAFSTLFAGEGQSLTKIKNVFISAKGNPYSPVFVNGTDLRIFPNNSHATMEHSIILIETHQEFPTADTLHRDIVTAGDHLIPITIHITQTTIPDNRAAPVVEMSSHLILRSDRPPSVTADVAVTPVLTGHGHTLMETAYLGALPHRLYQCGCQSTLLPECGGRKK